MVFKRTPCLCKFGKYLHFETREQTRLLWNLLGPESAGGCPECQFCTDGRIEGSSRSARGEEVGSCLDFSRNHLLCSMLLLVFV